LVKKKGKGKKKKGGSMQSLDHLDWIETGDLIEDTFKKNDSDDWTRL